MMRFKQINEAGPVNQPVERTGVYSASLLKPLHAHLIVMCSENGIMFLRREAAGAAGKKKNRTDGVTKVTKKSFFSLREINLRKGAKAVTARRSPHRQAEMKTSSMAPDEPSPPPGAPRPWRSRIGKGER